ncbi:MAG: hypothetical protein R3D84_17130 [Paracoccaceae bacterium]
MTPVWHLSFVGFIVAPLSAIPLGETGLARAILFATIPLAVLIWTVSLRQFLSQRMPPPLRPLFAIHLAPASLFAVAAAGLGLPALALGFAAAALLLLMVLVAAGRWLTEAGFSPLWGAFTFPLAAFANAAMAVSDQSALFWYAGGAALVAASLIVPPIAWKIMQAWSRGHACRHDQRRRGLTPAPIVLTHARGQGPTRRHRPPRRAALPAPRGHWPSRATSLRRHLGKAVTSRAPPRGPPRNETACHSPRGRCGRPAGPHPGLAPDASRPAAG